MNLGLSYNYAEMPDKGLEACVSGARHGDYAWLAICRAEAYVFLGDRESVLREIDTALADPTADHAVHALAMAYMGMIGEHERAQELLKELQQISESQFVSPLYLAYGNFGAGDVDSFFEYLHEAVDQKAMYAQWAVHVPHFRQLHGDPRFVEFEKRLNLPVAQP